MEDNFVVLLVEDDEDAASDFKDDFNEYFDEKAKLTIVVPPKSIYELYSILRQHQPHAVVLDQKLQRHSNAEYKGTDVFGFLRDQMPKLPCEIITEYPHDAQLEHIPYGRVHRKKDLDDPTEFRKFMEDLHQRMKIYAKEVTSSQDRKKYQPLDSEFQISSPLVEQVALEHFETDEAIEQIIWFEDVEQQEIRLIEVNRVSLPADEVQIFRFAPSDEVPFPIAIADVLPSEWEKIEKGEMTLPKGWDLEHSYIFRRHDLEGEEVENVG